ncbi:hypothetical protein ACWDE0_01050 [Streptomyces sp. 900105755]
MAGATGLHEALERFDGGRVVIDVADLPVKCPVAPLEFAFLADWYFQRRGIRDRVELTYATPLDAAFTKPVAAKALGGLLADKGIELVTEFTLGRVEGAGGRLVSYDERELPFDLAVVVPLHGGAEYVGRSEGLGDELGFWASSPSTRTPWSTSTAPRCSRSGTRQVCRRPRRGRWRTSRARCWCTTSAGSWPGNRWTPPSTGTPTASWRHFTGERSTVARARAFVLDLCLPYGLVVPLGIGRAIPLPARRSTVTRP